MLRQRPWSWRRPNTMDRLYGADERDEASPNVAWLWRSSRTRPGVRKERRSHCTNSVTCWRGSHRLRTNRLYARGRTGATSTIRPLNALDSAGAFLVALARCERANATRTSTSPRGRAPSALAPAIRPRHEFFGDLNRVSAAPCVDYRPTRTARGRFPRSISRSDDDRGSIPRL